MRPFNDVDLHAFVDQQGSQDRRDAIAAYLRTAPGDAARVDGWRRQNEAITSLFSSTLSEPVPLWLTVGQIIAEPDKPAPSGTKVLAKPVQRVAVTAPRQAAGTRASAPWLIALAAFVAGCVVPFAAADIPRLADSWFASASFGNTHDGFVQQAIEAHRTFAIDIDMPVDVADAPSGHLRAWFGRRLPYSLQIPDLTALGWTLKGGRLLSGVQGPGALLLYQRGANERLSLVTSETPDRWRRDRGQTAVEGVVSWVDGTVGYTVQSTLPASWLQEHAESIRAAVRDDALD